MWILVTILISFVFFCFYAVTSVMAQEKSDKTKESSNYETEEFYKRIDCIKRYLDAYEWCVKNLGVKDNALEKWKNLDDAEKTKKFGYFMCYNVSQYHHYKPIDFPEMVNTVPRYSNLDYCVFINFMEEFIGITDEIKKDQELVKLCDQYKVPVKFGQYNHMKDSTYKLGQFSRILSRQERRRL